VGILNAEAAAAEAASLWSWVACEACDKWRRLPRAVGLSIGDNKWVCRDSPDVERSRCAAPQELSNQAIDCEIALADQVYI
jgi:hypothetical protein